MIYRNSYTDVDTDVVRLAKKRARSLIKNIGFSADDLKDIQQELICAAIKQLAKFDLSRSGKLTFIGGILDKKAAQLFRNRTREKRHPSLEAFSLDEPLPDAVDECATYGDWLSDEKDRTWQILDLVIDVRGALASLPPKLRVLALFHAEMRPDEARQAACLTKSSHHRAMKQLRKHFERAGFGPGAKKPRNLSGRDGKYQG